MTTHAAEGDMERDGTTGRDALRAVFAVLAVGEPVVLALWRRSGLSLTQLNALRAVERGACSAGELAQQVGVPPSSLSRILERLEQRGLVERRTDPADRRRVRIALLPSGAATLAELRDVTATALVPAVEAMAPADRAALVRGAQALAAAARAAAGGGEGQAPPEGEGGGGTRGEGDALARSDGD
jgi:DNA-binding MarR family transcriptional regulator